MTMGSGGFVAQILGISLMYVSMLFLGWWAVPFVLYAVLLMMMNYNQGFGAFAEFLILFPLICTWTPDREQKIIWHLGWGGW